MHYFVPGTLEAKDPATGERIFSLISLFFSHYLGRDFPTFQSVAKFADENEAEFLAAVENRGLFIPSGSSAVMPLSQAIEKFKEELQTWRSPEFSSDALRMSAGRLVLYGICERLGPQYHLIENAEELLSHPMLCLPAQWHYHKLCAEMFKDQLVSGKLMQPGTAASLRSLSEPSLSWLGNVPIAALVKMRENNENEEFRRRIDSYTKQLHSASILDLDRTAAEVSRGIASMIGEHQRRVKEIEEEYSLIHGQTAVGSWVTLGATMLPILAPYAKAMAPFALMGKYATDKIRERQKKQKAAQSLMGVLATARSGK